MDDLNDDPQKVAEDIIKQATEGLGFRQAATDRIIHILNCYQQLQQEIAEPKELTSTGGLGENETKILILLSSHNQPLIAEIIAGELGLSLTKTKYYLEKMWRQYVYSHDFTSERPSEYYLSQKGREYLVENDLVE